MYIAIETKTEQFLLEAGGCKLEPVRPRQDTEPKTVKTRVLIVYCDDGRSDGVRNQYYLEPGDYVYLMNDTGKTINTFKI